MRGAYISPYPWLARAIDSMRASSDPLSPFPSGSSLPSLTGRARIQQLATPAKPVPLAATLLNPERRPCPLVGLVSSSSYSDLVPIRPSISLPELPTRTLPKRTPAGYNRMCPVVYGGLDYQRDRKPTKSRFRTLEPHGDDERVRYRKMENLKKMMRESARMFAKADANGDGMLDFNEFADMVKLQARLQRRAHLLSGKPVPEKQRPMPSSELLRDWFNLIDFNHSGSLSMTEYFAFSLREALARCTDGHATITAFLAVWEANETSYLDRDEFMKVCKALGFSAITDELMAMAEKRGDNEGKVAKNVSISDITSVVRKKANNSDVSHCPRVNPALCPSNAWM